MNRIQNGCIQFKDFYAVSDEEQPDQLIKANNLMNCQVITFFRSNYYCYRLMNSLGIKRKVKTLNKFKKAKAKA